MTIVGGDEVRHRFPDLGGLGGAVVQRDRGPRRRSLLLGVEVGRRVVDLGIHPAGPDVVDGDSVGAPLARHHPDDVPDGVLRGTVDPQRAERHRRVDRRGDDDAAARSLRTHLCGGGAAAVHDAVQVDAQHRVPVLARHLGEPLPARDAGVGHERVEPPQTVDRRLRRDARSPSGSTRRRAGTRPAGRAPRRLSRCAPPPLRVRRRSVRCRSRASRAPRRCRGRCRGRAPRR